MTRPKSKQVPKDKVQYVINKVNYSQNELDMTLKNVFILFTSYDITFPLVRWVNAYCVPNCLSFLKININMPISHWAVRLHFTGATINY